MLAMLPPPAAVMLGGVPPEPPPPPPPRPARPPPLLVLWLVETSPPPQDVRATLPPPGPPLPPEACCCCCDAAAAAAAAALEPEATGPLPLLPAVEEEGAEATRPGIMPMDMPVPETLATRFRYRRYFWRWLATFSRVSPSTFMISRIFFGTASVYAQGK